MYKQLVFKAYDFLFMNLLTCVCACVRVCVYPYTHQDVCACINYQLSADQNASFPCLRRRKVKFNLTFKLTVPMISTKKLKAPRISKCLWTSGTEFMTLNF